MVTSTRNRKAPRYSAPVVPTVTPTEHVLAAIRQLSDAYLSPDLPAVFAAVRLHVPLALGQFHDELRQLHAAGRVELLPFTRALATIESRDNAIFLDGEVRYFVRLQS
jgi:hypothetical protein